MRKKGQGSRNELKLKIQLKIQFKSNPNLPCTFFFLMVIMCTNLKKKTPKISPEPQDVSATKTIGKEATRADFAINLTSHNLSAAGEGVGEGWGNGTGEGEGKGIR